MMQNDSPCVGSGLCCKTGPCAFGEWLKEEKRCKYLEESYKTSEVIIYRCGRYDYIKQQPGNEWMPAFGAGCCMGMFNSARQNIIKLYNARDEGVVQALQGHLA